MNHLTVEPKAVDLAVALHVASDVQTYLDMQFGAAAFTALKWRRDQIIYSQGEKADSVYWIAEGYVKLTTLSDAGKEAVIAILSSGDCFGEACLGGHALRHTSAITISECQIRRFARDEIARLFREQPEFSQSFLSYLVTRNLQLEADLVDQLCNSCEKRLARTLLLLTRSEATGDESTILPRINQETLAAMVGTTQPRISYLLNKFKEQGFIAYGGGLHVNRALAEYVFANNS